MVFSGISVFGFCNTLSNIRSIEEELQNNFYTQPSTQLHDVVYKNKFPNKSPIVSKKGYYKTWKDIPCKALENQPEWQSSTWEMAGNTGTVNMLKWMTFVEETCCGGVGRDQ